MKGWNNYYKGIIEYMPSKKVTAVDAAKKTVLVEGIEEFKGDVINFIPAQRAAAIAGKAGLVGEDKKWCPVNMTTFESTLQKNIHVIGDSAIAGAMPKSGYSANSQAKVCAINVVASDERQAQLTELSGINICYSAISDHESISVAAVYTLKDGKIVSVPNSGGISPVDFSMTKAEHAYGESWLRNILTEMST